MSTKHWAALSLFLFLALIVAVLVLPPWSPVSVTSDDGPEPETFAQQPSESSGEVEVAETSTGESLEIVSAPTPTSERTKPLDTELAGPTSNSVVANPEPTSEPQSTSTLEPTTTMEAPSANEPSPTPTATVSAATEISTGQEPSNVDELIRLTDSEVWKVRWDAVNELGRLKDPKAIPALVKRALYDDNSHPRWRSLWALALTDRAGTKAVPLLLDGLDSSEPEVVRNAAVALASFSQHEARPELIRGLDDPDNYRRWEAVFSLKNIGGPEVVNALIGVLNDGLEPETRVRQEAALTLGRIGGDGVASALLIALREDSSHQVRWRAAAALSRLGDDSVVGDLEQALSNEEHPQVLENIEKAIAKLQKSQ